MTLLPLILAPAVFGFKCTFEGFTLAMPLGRKTLKMISHLKEIKHEKLCVACGMVYTKDYLDEQLIMWAVSFFIYVLFVCRASHKRCFHYDLDLGSMALVKVSPANLGMTGRLCKRLVVIARVTS